MRYFAGNGRELYVVTGSILEDDLNSIGNEHVSVPEQFYKIVFDPKRSTLIAFLIPHQNSDRSIYDYVVPVDSIEILTGTDYFYQLSDDVEDRLESSIKRDIF